MPDFNILFVARSIAMFSLTAKFWRFSLVNSSSNALISFLAFDGGFDQEKIASYSASIAESVAWFSTHSDLPPGFIRNPGTDVGISNNKENPFKGAYA